MKEVKVIIGANFGDEGKGVMTEYTCRTSEKPIVIRFNSGSQAGHTVVTEDGIRHVFGHFGSGTFCNVPTYLSKYFVVNPLTFLKERDELIRKGANPIVYVDDECLITTPYDMLINQIVETSRGNNRHGSCGLGFNETLVRNRNTKYQLKIKDLGDKDIRVLLLKIGNEYINSRLEEL